MKIGIIKLGALGDVVRTLGIIPAVKKRYPDSEITWITRPASVGLFEGNPDVSRVCTLPFKVKEEFDVLYNFDFDDEATSLAKKINAKKKYGFSSEDGFPSVFNLASEYYINTMFDDELKKSNDKTYQEMMFEAAELPYNKERPELFLGEKDKKFALNFIKNNKMDEKKIIGVHLGAGKRWPSKAWAEEKVVEFIKKLKEEGKEVILFGGPDDSERNNRIIKELDKNKVSIIYADTSKSIREFIALASICDRMVCSDSFALHISLALGKKTIGLFFCTSPDEVEGYDLLKKIVSPKLYNFFPEKMNEFDESLVNSIKVDEVIKAIG